MSSSSPALRPADGQQSRSPALGLAIPTPPSTSSTPSLAPPRSKRPLGPALSLPGPIASPGTAAAPAPGKPSLKLGPGALQLNTQKPSLSLPISNSSSKPTSALDERSATDDDDILPDLEKLSLEKGRPLDVEDLDDKGWRAFSEQKKIIEIGSLGEGAGGAVTKCVLKGGKTVFALKVITADPNPDVKKQIVRELDFNKDCVSPFICQYYGAFADNDAGNIFIAMEFCEGGSLDNVYREVKRLGGRCGEKVLGKVAESVLNGLSYLASRKIIHRDIKPSNVLLCRNGQVKLCDLGVSGEMGSMGGASTFIGTSFYMAPERITGQSYTITSDVWSLGVTLLEVASHKFPFTAPDGSRAGLIDLITCIVSQPIPKLQDEPENDIKWSNKFKTFIDACLVKEGTKRLPPQEMLKSEWMLEIKNKRVNMEHFLKVVWNWKD